MKYKTSIIVIMAFLMVPALASANRSDSTKAINQAMSLIESAERNEANQNAPILLKAARDNLALAKREHDDREWVDAEIAAKMAQRDAEVADAKSKSMKAEKSYNDLKAAVDLLRSELDRKRRMQ